MGEADREDRVALGGQSLAQCAHLLRRPGEPMHEQDAHPPTLKEERLSAGHEVRHEHGWMIDDG
jgi:hypothetical protein